MLVAGGLFILKICHVIGDAYWPRYALVAGLFVYACAREKVEDEMIEKIRLSAFHISLISAVLYFLVAGMIYHFDGSHIQQPASELVMIQLGGYILSFLYEMSRIQTNSAAG